MNGSPNDAPGVQPQLGGRKRFIRQASLLRHAEARISRGARIAEEFQALVED
jgi:hypothetical protein